MLKVEARRADVDVYQHVGDILKDGVVLGSCGGEHQILRSDRQLLQCLCDFFTELSILVSKRGQFTIFTIYLEFGYGLLPLCKIQHLTKQLRTSDILHDPRMIDVLDHHGEGFDGGLLDVDDILRSSKRTKELSPEDRADRC